ncbi:MSL9 [Scenedesmus sp. PABB004]|nr:MSL9 [Scenedesmus sp. PABB004]
MVLSRSRARRAASSRWSGRPPAVAMDLAEALEMSGAAAAAHAHAAAPAAAESAGGAAASVAQPPAYGGAPPPVDCARAGRPSRLSASLGCGGAGPGASPPESPQARGAGGAGGAARPPSLADMMPHPQAGAAPASPPGAAAPSPPKLPPAPSPPRAAAAATAGGGSDASDGDGDDDDGYAASGAADSDAGDSFLASEPAPLWWRRPACVCVAGLLALSGGLVVAGLVCQLGVDEAGLAAGSRARAAREAYPWFFFFSAFPPLGIALRWLCWRAYSACFEWLWCQDERCAGPTYQRAISVVWRLDVCIALFSAACFIKCALARMLSLQFSRTAHFVKVKQAIERELYLIRLAKARRTLEPEPAPASQAGSDGCGGAPGGTRRGSVAGRAGAWLAVAGSVMWRHGSQVLGSGRRGSEGRLQELPPPAGGGDDVDGAAPGAPCCGSAPGQGSLDVMPSPPGGSLAGPAGAGPATCKQAIQETSRDGSCADGNCCEGVTAFVQLGGGAAGGRVPASGGGKLKRCASKATPRQARPPRGGEGRQPSFEHFLAARVPSLLGPGAAGGRSRPGSRASRAGAGAARLGSRATLRADSRVSLPGMVPGVDGLLLQPEVLEEVALAAREQGRASDPAMPVSEEELDRMRKALGVNTFGTFVDRYLGMTPKEEAAHVRHVKRFAKGLFANIRGDAERDHLLPADFTIFFAGDAEVADDAFHLEAGLGLLVHFVFLIFYLLVWGVNIVKSALYLFVEHPYDVGDLLVLPGGTMARVKKIDLMYTQLVRGSGELVWHPNSMMRAALLVNLSRSGPKWEGFSWLVDADTPDEVLASLEAALAAHVVANAAHFWGQPTVTWKGLEDPLKLRLAVGVTYSFSGEDVRRWVTVRTAFLGVVRRELQAAGVRYTVPPGGSGVAEVFAETLRQAQAEG